MYIIVNMPMWHSAGGFLQERSRGFSKPSELVKRKCSVWRIFYQSKIWWTEEHRAANNPKNDWISFFERCTNDSEYLRHWGAIIELCKADFEQARCGRKPPVPMWTRFMECRIFRIKIRNVILNLVNVNNPREFGLCRCGTLPRKTIKYRFSRGVRTIVSTFVTEAQ